MSDKPCGWEPLWADGTPCPAFEGLPSETKTAAVDLAAFLLWTWTGRTLGVCEEEAFPAVPEAACYGSATPALAAAWSTARGPLACGCQSAACRCDGRGGAVALPGPIHEVLEVAVAGFTLDPSAYTVRGRRYLARTDGGRWPDGCDELWVRYLRGTPLPAEGRLALGRFACELALAYADDDECRLPERIQSLTRQGVTLSFSTGQDGEGGGETGIWEIDAWIEAMNRPRPVASTVRSPDYGWCR